MNPDHEAVQELLAAHALHMLDAGESERAERLIASHVPDCAECQRLFEDFQVVAGELALAAGARRPPRLLGARLHHQVRSSRRSRWISALVTAVAAVALITLAGWSAHLSGRVSQGEKRQARTGEFLAIVSHPGSHVIPLSPAKTPTSSEVIPVQLAAAYVPGAGNVYLFGSLPTPRSDGVYQVWVRRNGQFESEGTFRPEKGQVLIRIDADPDQFDELLVTEEPGVGSVSPSDQRVVTASF